MDPSIVNVSLLQKMSHLPVDLLGVFKNGNYVAYDRNAKVHHDVFAEVHQHVLVNSAVTHKKQKRTILNCVFTATDSLCL